ncbi:hypothetical protein Tco_0646404 [Tanacetum coccineum]
MYHSFMPDVSHRSGTFIKFNVYPNRLNESPMMILSSTCSPMDMAFGDFPDCEDSQVSTRVSHPQLHFGNPNVGVCEMTEAVMHEPNDERVRKDQAPDYAPFKVGGMYNPSFTTRFSGTGSLPSGCVDLTGDEDPTDEDGDIGMGDSTGVSASLGGEIFSGGKKCQESNIGDSDNTGDGGKIVGGAIGACGGIAAEANLGFLKWVEAKMVNSDVGNENWRRFLLHEMCDSLNIYQPMAVKKTSFPEMECSSIVVSIPDDVKDFKEILYDT